MPARTEMSPDQQSAHRAAGGADPLPEPIRQFISSTNRGDRAGVLDCFRSDSVLIDWDQRYEGIQAISAWDGTDNTGAQVRIEILAREPCFQGQRVTVLVSGNGFNGTGQMNFQLLNNKIAVLLIK
jgi:hypothetical protein